MAGSSADIEALLVNFRDLDDHTPCQLPAIFRDVVARLNAHGFPYAVVGRIALSRYDEARYVNGIEIVMRLIGTKPVEAATLSQATHERFAPYMDRRIRSNAISLTLRASSEPIEDSLVQEATGCRWFGIEARLASPEHLLWLWCRSAAIEHSADAVALIRSNAVDLQRVRHLLRETDDLEETGQMRLRTAIGDAVLASEFSFSRFMEERRTRLKPDRVPVWRLLPKKNRQDRRNLASHSLRIEAQAEEAGQSSVPVNAYKINDLEKVSALIV